MQYRLHIDIPLGIDEEQAIEMSRRIVSTLRVPSGVSQINYRLGHDEDRQKSNYLDKNENGHVSNKKIKITIE